MDSQTKSNNTLKVQEVGGGVDEDMGRTRREGRVRTQPVLVVWQLQRFSPKKTLARISPEERRQASYG